MKNKNELLTIIKNYTDEKNVNLSPYELNELVSLINNNIPDDLTRIIEDIQTSLPILIDEEVLIQSIKSYLIYLSILITEKNNVNIDKIKPLIIYLLLYIKLYENNLDLDLRQFFYKFLISSEQELKEEIKNNNVAAKTISLNNYFVRILNNTLVPTMEQLNKFKKYL